MSTFTLNLESSHYPRQLAVALAGTAPRQLHCRGNLDLLASKTISFSGSRKASARGLDQADAYAGQFAREGWTVVSGYAVGVDQASHRAALAAGGSTILVLPHGLGGFWLRPELQTVWDWKRALVVSQFDDQVPFQAFRAIQRNAVIAGLSRGVLVFEPGSLGGTLNTGMAALRLEVPLFAAVYQGMPPAAVGHRRLLARGGWRVEMDRGSVTNEMRKMTQIMDIKGKASCA